MRIPFNLRSCPFRFGTIVSAKRKIIAERVLRHRYGTLFAGLRQV
jgi:hypothetical protein